MPTIRVARFALALIVVSSTIALPAHGTRPPGPGAQVVFGPKDYVRSKGRPTAASARFEVSNPAGRYTLRIVNGGKHGRFRPVHSAEVRLNGRRVITERDFAGHHRNRDRRTTIERRVALEASNRLVVELDGPVGSGITLVIEGKAAPEPIPLTISNVVAPASVPFGTPASIAFDYADGDGDIASLEAIGGNALGQVAVSLSAAFLGITGTQGRASIALPAEELSFGTNTYTLQLRDAAGHASNTATVAIAVVGEGSGGSAPAVTNLTTSSLWSRPAGPLDRVTPPFTLSYADADGDILLVRQRLVRPDGSATLTEAAAGPRGIEGAGGTLTATFFTLRATDPLGAYRVEVTLLDAGGRASNTATASFDLVAANGEAPPAVTAFSPAQGGAGTNVTLTGSGFDASSASANRAELGGVPVDVSAATASALTIVVPDGAASGRFVVRTRNGVAASAGTFVVPASDALSPQEPEVVVGGTLQFDAGATSTTATGVAWKVNGVDGGSSATGVITPQGFYTAPAALPAGGEVTVSASLVGDPSVLASTVVAIVPPPSAPGRAHVLAPVGGRIVSVDGRAIVDVPPGALASDVVITAATLGAAALPPAQPGRRAVGGVRLGPSPLQFLTPVTVTIPLTRYYTPGTALALRLFDEATGAHTNHGVAIVAASGEHAVGSVPHFSDAVVDDDETLEEIQAVCQSPIAISGFEAGGALQEGLKVPVRLTGTGFTPELRVRIVATAGGRAEDVAPGALYTLGTRAAVVLDVQTIRDLGVAATGQPQLRTYSLRLERPGFNCQFAEVPFVVEGLNEFDAANPRPGRYSEIVVPEGVTVAVPVDGLAVESTGPVSIRGRIDAGGAPGANASDQRCGGLPAGHDDEECGRHLDSHDGRGGLGREDSDLHRNNLGATGTPFDELDSGPAAGGWAGSNIDIGSAVENLAEAILAGIECFAGSVVSCPQIVTSLIDAGENVVDATEGPSGRPGFGGKPRGSGGGGGGAGFLSTPPMAFLPPPLTGSKLLLLGGGGGQGGEAGRRLTIVTPDAVEFMGGQATAAGGRGGDGSAKGRIKLAIRFLPDVTIDLPVDIPTFRGGGGGGGGGGSLLIGSGTGLVFSSSVDAQATAAGGEGGMNSSRRAIGSPGTRYLADPARSRGGFFQIFDPSTLETMATNRSLVPVRVASGAEGDITIRVEGENGQVREIVARPGEGFTHTANVVLFSGFNTICVSAGNPCASFAPAWHQLLQKRVLSVFVDSDGDSLSDIDEVAVGTNPVSSDSDGDGLSDGDELADALDPLDNDTDNDGLQDGEEVHQRHTNPRDPDSDDDGATDGIEVAFDSNPLSAAVRPTEVPPGTLLAQSGSDLVVVMPATGLSAVLARPTVLGFGLAFNREGTLFIVDGGILRTFDPISGASVEIGALGSGITVATLAYNPGDDLLYGVEFGANAGQLVRIDPRTGGAERVGAGPDRPVVRGLDFTRDGRLLTTVSTGGTDQLVELSPATGAIVRDIGSVGFAGVYGLAVDRSGALFGAANISATDSQLLAIDVSSGAATPLSTVFRPLFDLAVAPCPGPCFAPKATVPLSGGSARPGIAIADADGNGTQDVITVEQGTPQLVVLPGRGDGTFGAARTFAALPFPTGLAVGDLNGDGAPDAVVAHNFSQTIAVMLNDGAGTFLPPDAYGVGAPQRSGGLAIADLTNDGFADIALAAGAGVVLLISDGTGHFVSALVPGVSPSTVTAIGVGNLDGDTSPGAGGVVRPNLDLVVGHINGRVDVLFGDGTGQFLRFAVHPLTLLAASIDVADVNGDGAPDVALVDGERQNTVVVALNDGAGVLSAGVTYSAGDPDDPGVAYRPFAVRIADVTGDHAADLVTANDPRTAALRSISVLNGNGAGTFAPARRSPFAVDGAAHIAIGDLNGDGLLDVVTPNAAGVTVLLNQQPF